MFMKAAAPPNRAAAAMAPVFCGIAPPLDELVAVSVAAEEAELGPTVLMEVVAMGTPLVNGTSDAEVALPKAGA